MIIQQVLIFIFAISAGDGAGFPTQTVIEAIQNRNLENAATLVSNATTELNDTDRQSIIDMLQKMSPQGDWVPLLTELARKTDRDGRFLFFLAQASWRAGDLDAAMEFSGKAMQSEPKNESLLYQCAAIARTSGRFDEARRRIGVLLDRFPGNADGVFLRGSIQLEEGDLKGARDSLTQAVVTNPRHIQALYELGKLEIREGNDKEAVRRLHQAIQVYPFFREAYSALRTPLGRLKEKKELDHVQEILTRTQSWNPDQYARLRHSFDNPFSIKEEDRAELARELARVGRDDLSKQYLEALLKRGLMSDQLTLALGQLRFNQREYESALILLNGVKSEAIKNTSDYQGLKAWCLLSLKRVDECRAIVEQYGNTFQDSPHFIALKKAMAGLPDAAQEAETSHPETNGANRIHFIDKTEEAGLSGFKHTLGHADKRWIVDAMGSGIAAGDYDNDGDDDLVFVNGRPDLDKPDAAYQNALFRNDGGRFTNVSGSAGVGDRGFGMCAVWGDADGDGWLDLFIGNVGANTFYHNNGDGTFSDWTEKAALMNDGYAAAAAFGDVDGDGDLDLFVGNYVDFNETRDGERRENYNGQTVMMGPRGFQAQPDLLYINDGSGRFTENAKPAGINQDRGRAMGAALADLDLDGDLDLYVANDSSFNHVLKNDGHGHFEDVSFFSGAAVGENGQDGASMGVAVGDVNNDGALDLMVTSYEQETDVLFINQGDGSFRDASAPMGLVRFTRWLTTWGVGFCDFDADGRQDYYTVNGHTYPQVENLPGDRAYKQRASFYWNADGRFEDCTNTALEANIRAFAGRGSALIDYDGDGDMDIAVNCIDDAPLLLENTSTHGSWLQVNLGVNARAYGSRIVARRGDSSWTRVVDGGSGYLSQNSSTVHFGFGGVNEIDEFTIYWTGGAVQTVTAPALNQRVNVQFAPSHQTK
ncbi:MAG: tetratricopeptide repeat protein [bacterium]|nr:tetratricopeptide repeat protein [bacterium]